jgi:hypothetical protein
MSIEQMPNEDKATWKTGALFFSYKNKLGIKNK